MAETLLAQGDVQRPDQWLPRRDRHRKRVDERLAGYLRRRAEGRPHPVIDFLFTYYNLTPGQLRRWHPGFGVALTGPQANEYADLSGYQKRENAVAVDSSGLVRRRDTIAFVARLMGATAGRRPNLGCFGLHEWAMVYRVGDGQLRHSESLRLGRDGTNAVVESMPLRCTHFDAFRFFTDAARPMNTLQLTRSGQTSREQPGCLHAGMDIYKFASKLLPLIGSDLLLDAFELAFDARELDMRASPYDLRHLGYEPVRIENAAGRTEYVRRQTAIYERSISVRASLKRACDDLLQITDAASGRSGQLPPGRG